MINDRLADAKGRAAKRAGSKRKAAAIEGGEGGEGEVEEGGGEGEEEDSKIALMEERVTTLTGQLEEKMRKLVDAEVRTTSLADGLVRIHREALAAAPATPQGKRRRMRRRAGEESEGDEEEGEDEGEEQPSVEESSQRRDDGTCKALRKELKEKKVQWKEMSLTDRYGVSLLFCLHIFISTNHDKLHNKQQIHRLLPHGARIEAPRRRDPASPAPIHLVRGR